MRTTAFHHALHVRVPVLGLETSWLKRQASPFRHVPFLMKQRQGLADRCGLASLAFADCSGFNDFSSTISG
jgi:hypothetical protein